MNLTKLIIILKKLEEERLKLNNKMMMKWDMVDKEFNANNHDDS